MNTNWFKRIPHVRPLTGAAVQPCPTLASFPGGSQVRVTGFGELNAQYLQHLQAYGLLPGRTLKILAQHPLTIILAEQTELALETSVALQVFVELLDIPV
jgi:Fe2+ transport system protein FeoA